MNNYDYWNDLHQYDKRHYDSEKMRILADVIQVLEKRVVTTPV